MVIIGSTLDNFPGKQREERVREREEREWQEWLELDISDDVGDRDNCKNNNYKIIFSYPPSDSNDTKNSFD